MNKSALFLSSLTTWNLNDFYSVEILKNGLNFQGRLTNETLAYYKDLYPFEVSINDHGYVCLEYITNEGMRIKIVFTA